MVAQVTLSLHRLLDEPRIQLAACLLDPANKPTKVRISSPVVYMCTVPACPQAELQLTISYAGPGQHDNTPCQVGDAAMERDDSTEKEEELEDDQRALLNLERNIQNIERSMSASQLEQANYPGKNKGVRVEQR